MYEMKHNSLQDQKIIATKTTMNKCICKEMTTWYAEPYLRCIEQCREKISQKQKREMGEIRRSTKGGKRRTKVKYSGVTFPYHIHYYIEVVLTRLPSGLPDKQWSYLAAN